LWEYKEVDIIKRKKEDNKSFHEMKFIMTGKQKFMDKPKGEEKQ